jgi:glutathione peroxidase
VLNFFDYKVKKAGGAEFSLADYRGKIVLVVNVASECGFTTQYTGLQKLQEEFSSVGFTVLGFPCNQFGGQEPGSDTEIQNFCSARFQVKFPIFAKVDVNGKNEEPLFTFLKQKAPGFLGSKKIKWNFTKFLIDREGRVVKRFAPTVSPEKIVPEILKIVNS